MQKMKMHTPNFTQDNIARIRELFPGCVTESVDDPQMTQIPADENPENHNLRISAQSADKKIRLKVDFDLLRQELSEHIVEGPQERYHLALIIEQPKYQAAKRDK